MQVYKRLNHLNITVSYNFILRVVEEISKHHLLPLSKWISEGAYVKFVSDNVDTRKRVREIRSDHHDINYHMYSMLVVKARVLPPPICTPFVRPSVVALPASSFFPSLADVRAMKRNLVFLVGRLLCENMKQFKYIANMLPKHIYHEYSDEMCQKSEVLVVDVLHKNEAKHDDMKIIMQTIQKYMGAYDGMVLSGGDQLTCERQRCSKFHVMDGNTPEDRLDKIEPVIEDWHTLMCFLKVY